MRLTPRQVEVLRLVSEGLTDKEIAIRLGIRASSVKNHCRNAYDRLGAVNRPHAVKIFLTNYPA